MIKLRLDDQGQLSAEYLLLLVVILLILSVITIPLVTQSIGASSDVSHVSDASNAVNNIANAVNVVYANGPGAKRTVKVYIPQDNFILNRSGTYVNGTVNFVNGGNKTVVARTNYPVIPWTFNMTKGWYTFTIQWNTGSNQISIQYTPG